MTDTALVHRKLAMLAEHVARARSRGRRPWKDLEGDADRQDALAMSILVAIQEAVDIAFHVVSDEGWGLPRTYADAFMLLGANGVIDAVLAQELSAATGLRNRIAHGYAAVDFQRLHGELPRGLAALDRYSTAVAAWLEACR